MCDSKIYKHAGDKLMARGVISRVKPPSPPPVQIGKSAQGGMASQKVMGVPTKQRSTYVKGRGLLTEANLTQPTLLG